MIENIALLEGQQQILDQNHAQAQDQDRKNKLKTLVAFHYLELSKMLYSGAWGTYSKVNERSFESSQQPTSRINDIIESIPHEYQNYLNFEDRKLSYQRQPMRTINAHCSIHLPNPASKEQKGLSHLANGKVLKTYIPVSLPPMGGDGTWRHRKMTELGAKSKTRLLFGGEFGTLFQRLVDPVFNRFDDKDYTHPYSESEKDSYLLSSEAEAFRDKSFLPHYCQNEISGFFTGKETKDVALQRAIGGQASQQVQALPSLFSWAPAMWATKKISPEERSIRDERYKEKMMLRLKPSTNACRRQGSGTRDKYVKDTEFVRGLGF